ncbi:MAG: DUF11 domain-containing protein [Burkholderiaceae bacterium]|jgi:uncharacterized repeat protein (TIGR01451 family)|nr:DUF11 domain-containing protein [Burkholderiaceae bacterium]
MKGRAHAASSSPTLRTAKLTAGATLLLGAFMAAPALAQVTLPPTNAVPTSVWKETFSTGMTPAAAVPLYEPAPYPAGLPAPYASDLYSAGSAWVPSYGGCNGWVLSSTSTRPTTAQDAGCNADGGEVVGGGSGSTDPLAWSFLKAMAAALAGADGDNYTVASMTNGGVQAAGVQLAATSASSVNPFPLLTDGHFYALSVQFAEVHCKSDDKTKTAWQDASEVLTFNGKPSAPENPCAPLTSGEVVSTADGPIHLATLYSGAILAQAPADTVTGFEVQNQTAAYAGNDVAFNLPQIMDVTPQLYKSFNPDPHASDGDYTTVPGGTATLTFMIVNTTDYLEKDGWSFIDTLPGDLTVNSVGTVSCGAGSVDTSSVVTGANKIALTGNLAPGQNNGVCTIQVIVNVPGDESPYTNGPGNITEMNGLLEPNEVVLNTSELAATKTVVSVSTDAGGINKITDVNGNPIVTAVGEYINYQIEIQNSTNMDVPISGIKDSAMDTGFNGSGGSVDFTCEDTKVPAETGGVPGSLKCTAQYQVTSDDMNLQPQPPATIAYINNIAEVDSAAGNPTTNPVRTPVLPPTLSITKSADSTIMVVGKTINFSFVVTNTGAVPLTDVSVTDGKSTGFVADLTVPCPATELDPGATMTCTAQYTITQADMAAGSLSNTAIATGWGQGTPPPSPVPPLSTDGTNLSPGEAWAKSQVQLTNGIVGVTPVPTLDARALALLALLLSGLGYFVQRKRQ